MLCKPGLIERFRGLRLGCDFISNPTLEQHFKLAQCDRVSLGKPLPTLRLDLAFLRIAPNRLLSLPQITVKL